MMTNKKHITDQEIDDYLEGETPTSKIYTEGEDIKSPKHLDRLIHDFAHEEVNKSNYSTKKNEWLVFSSIAATFLMVVSITFYFNNQNINETNEVAIKKKTQPPQTASKEILSNINKEQVNSNSLAPDPIAKKKASEKITAKEKDDFVLPSGLQDLLQNTNASSTNVLIADEVLKTWTREQWKKKVLSLKEQNKIELSKKYIDKFPIFFPGETLFTNN